MNIKYNYYIYLFNSPWPLLSVFSSFNFFMSLYFFFKYSNFYNFFISFFLVLFVSFYWWRDYNREFLSGAYSSFVDFSVKFSMMFFIGSEIFFFFSFFWSYFHFYLSPLVDLGLEWPPFSVSGFSFLNVPLLNTIFLLSSGVTLTFSHYLMVKGDYRLSSLYLFYTIFMGLLFTFFQYLEYENSFFCMSDSSYGSVFFLLTGFHGIHVIIGSSFLINSLLRLGFFYFTKEHVLSFELCSWYWHFVDVVWVFLYFFIYFLV